MNMYLHTTLLFRTDWHPWVSMSSIQTYVGVVVVVVVSVGVVVVVVVSIGVGVG